MIMCRLIRVSHWESLVNPKLFNPKAIHGGCKASSHTRISLPCSAH